MSPLRLIASISARLVASGVRRQHSTMAFAPTRSTSAETETPYGDLKLASSVYLPLQFPTATPMPNRDAAHEDPKLTALQRDIVEKIVRVDQAGELGANWIYAGQHAVFSKGPDHRLTDLIQEMWDGEKKHIAVFNYMVTQMSVRPTALYPVWKMMGFALGAGTALMGKRAAMACTEAVETAIGEHYDSQLRDLQNEFIFPPGEVPASISLLKDIVTEFRDDELGHLNTAIQNESQLAPVHALLTAVIGFGCKVAIATTERI